MNIFLLIAVLLLSAIDLFRAAIMLSAERIIKDWKNYLVVVGALSLIPLTVFLTGTGISKLFSLFLPLKSYLTQILLLFMGVKILTQGISNRQVMISRDTTNFKGLALMALIVSFNPFLAGLAFGAIPNVVFLTTIALLLITFILTIVGMVFSAYLKWFLNKAFPVISGIFILVLIVIEFVRQNF